MAEAFRISRCSPSLLGLGYLQCTLEQKMTANLKKWPAFHSTGEDHPPLPLFPPNRLDGCSASSTRINLMPIAPYGRRATLFENEKEVPNARVTADAFRFLTKLSWMALHTAH